MKTILGIVIALALIWGVVSFLQPDEWLPTYYPNPHDLTIHTTGPITDSLERCRDWIDGEAMRRGQSVGEYDYECGLNCKLDYDYGLFVCEDTLQ